jgi:hypothetical protein
MVEHRFVVPRVVGSSPIVHPIDNSMFFLYDLTLLPTFILYCNSGVCLIGRDLNQLISLFLNFYNLFLLLSGALEKIQDNKSDI